MAADEPLLDVAAAVADGKAVNWESASRSITDDEDRRLLAELRFIASVACRIPDDSSASAPAVERSSPRAALPPTGSPIDTWGPLKIIEHVGRGTFGDVYRAWDSRLDREVALKILRRKDPDDQTDASAVIEEGRLLARVRHPSVVTVYGAERVNGQVGVWMEFVHGKTLEQQLREQGPFDVDRVIKIGIELSEALSTIHRAGLIHGDVKAQNVLCERDGRLVMTDFGAGIELEEASSGSARELTGTPLCVAPEVLVGQSASPRTDLYSLGVLLYHLLTGTYPVRGRSLKEIRDAHGNGTRVPLYEARPDLPRVFVRILERAIDPDPTARHETLDAFHGELSALIPKDTDASRPDLESADARRRRPWWVPAAVVLAVIISTTALMLYRAQTVPNAIDAKIARRVFVPLSQLVGANTRWPTVAPEAYELYLRGSAAAERGGQSGRLALELYEQAIALDPAFVQAHAAIAHLALNNVASLGLPPEQRYERAKAAAERAMALDAQLPEAHLAAARVKSAARDWPGAEGEYRRAIELAPNSSLFRREYAMWLSLHARFTEAIAEADRSIRLDPLSPHSRYMAGLVRRFARKCEEAGPHLQKALELDPQYGPAHQEIGQCHQMAGRHDLAIEEYRRAAQPPGNLGHALALSGRTAEARTLLAELIERHGESGNFPGIAIIYVGLGEYERALDWLERDLSPLGVGTLKVAAVWDPLRSHPRFAQILRKRELAP